jgi:predicted dehydrogenase
MKVAVLGCGLIGEKRGKQLSGHTCVGVFDPDRKRAEKLAAELKTKVWDSEDACIKNSGAEIVIVATTNNVLAPASLRAVRAGKHVLVEKPAAIRVSEIEELDREAHARNVAVKVGFNHRFHPAMLKARELIDAGALGELMFLRARYGHGGRVGYEKEWRSIPEIGGGGELLDQGVHLLDLIYWYMGPLPLHSSLVTTSFWKMPVDDNAVITVAEQPVLPGVSKWATFHVSCSEWKNTFTLEIYGRTGKILVSGIGRSYGKETLTYYKMLPEMGPPKIETFDFPEEDRSWELDMKNLVDHIQNGTPLWGDLKSAHYALTQVRAAYQANGYTGVPSAE